MGCTSGYISFCSIEVGSSGGGWHRQRLGQRQPPNFALPSPSITEGLAPPLEKCASCDGECIR